MLRQWLHRRRLLRERRATAKQRKAANGNAGGGLLADPIEDDPAIQPMLVEAERIAGAELADHKQGMGFCFIFWGTKQRILLEKFNIIWFSPAEMNPGTRFD